MENTQLQNKLNAIEEKLTNQTQKLRKLSSIIKREALRSGKLQNNSKTTRNDGQMFQFLIKPDGDKDEYDEYTHLLTKQISGKILQTMTELSGQKVLLSKVPSYLKSNKNSEAEQSLESIQKKINSIAQSFNLFFQNNSYLILNYRLDIAVKELEKWNKGLNLNFTLANKDVEALFQTEQSTHD